MGQIREGGGGGRGVSPAFVAKITSRGGGGGGGGEVSLLSFMGGDRCQNSRPLFNDLGGGGGGGVCCEMLQIIT